MPPNVEVRPEPEEQRVEITAAGEPFATYLYRDDLSVLSKPVLFPIRSASGHVVTRGYPLEPRPGERVDHDHHIGHSLTYGADPGVNGVNFWGVSDAVGSDETDRGVIRHEETVRVEGGAGSGELTATLRWERGDGRRILDEDVTFRFEAEGDRRVIDRTSTWTAVDGDVTFPDDKEGMFAVRTNAALEHPADETITVVAEDGGTEEIPGDRGRTGEYLTSEGDRGRDAWGTRAEWVRLSGEIDADPVSITIMDHPENVGHPTYWHARGYGLFSANPLGQAVYSDGEEVLDFELPEGEAATFRYRIAIDEGRPGPDELDDRYDAFVEGHR